ncbi:hypothetical protein SDC9_198223 [bioreactor metagenome]|uniref:Uncharacterized protein n=1 Tax=bioreactor metagenome TaxID=1076179 RepID=A0A645IID1_9ZZZZ
MAAGFAGVLALGGGALRAGVLGFAAGFALEFDFGAVLFVAGFAGALAALRGACEGFCGVAFLPLVAALVLADEGLEVASLTAGEAPISRLPPGSSLLTANAP